MDNWTQIEEYMAEVEKQIALVNRLAQWLDDMGEVAPDDVNWEHVGSMRALTSALRQIINQFIEVVE